MNKILQKNLISFFLLLGIITFTACSIISYMQYSRLSQSYDNLIESYQTIRAANQSLISIDEAALSVSVFLQTKNVETLSQIPQSITAAEVNFGTLKQLVSDDPVQKDLANKLTPLFENKINFLKNIMREYLAGQISQAMKISSDKNRLQLTHEITSLIIAIKQEEIKQLITSSINLKIYKSETKKLILSIGILSALLFLCCFIFLNNYLKRY